MIALFIISIVNILVFYKVNTSVKIYRAKS